MNSPRFGYLKHLHLICLLSIGFLCPRVTAEGTLKSGTLRDLRTGVLELLPTVNSKGPRLLLTPEGLEARRKEYAADPGFFDAFIGDGRETGGSAQSYGSPSAAAGNANILARLAMGQAISGKPESLNRLRQAVQNLEGAPLIRTKSMGSGNMDLNAGVFLFGLAICYDMTRESLGESERAVLGDLLARQAEAFYEDVQKWPKISYDQNHLIIPLCGLGVAALALSDQDARASSWGAFARNALERSFRLLAPDGWFHEGAWYWNYTLQYGLPYVSALKRAAGVDLMGFGLFENLPLYLAHIYTPNPDFIFDFADSSANVQSKGAFQPGWDWEWHRYPIRSFLSIPGILHQERPQPFLDDSIRFLAPVSTNGTFARQPGVTVMDALFHMATRAPRPTEKVTRPQRPGAPPYHYFKDMEVVHWRQNWGDPDAMAFAFKSGPPAGHEFARVLTRKEYPDWTPSLGHAHPDAGSFIVFAHGVYLANDSGYLGKKESADHNCILVDGEGQFKGGTAWDTFAQAPYSKYDPIHLTNVWLSGQAAAAKAVYHTAYHDRLELTRMERTLFSVAGRWILVHDLLESGKEHTWEWRLHGDQPAKRLGETAWRMENGPGVLVVHPLLPVASAEVRDTIVEAGCYDESRKQQRGSHLAQISSPSASFQFLNVLTIQKAGDPATLKISGSPERVEVVEGADRVTLFLGNSADLKGHYGYVWQRADGRAELGFYGTELRFRERTFHRSKIGPVHLVASPSGPWQASTLR